MQSLKGKYADYFKVGVAINEATIISHEDMIKNTLTVPLAIMP